MTTKIQKSAMVSTEVAIGVALSAIALFVALGLFGDNLSNMISSSKFNNVTSSNDTKTDYQKFKRDYSDSQVNVQIMGEQGLEMLRRKANNKAIEVIEQSFSNTNPDGNSIAYLSTALKILTGEPHICTTMKKDSDKHCDEIGEYDYNLGLSGSAIIVQRTAIKDENGQMRNAGQVSVPVNGVVASVLSAVSVPIDEKGYSVLKMEEKYTLIKDVTSKLISYIRSDVVLLRGALSSTKSTLASQSVGRVVSSISNLSNIIAASVNQAQTTCGDDDNGDGSYSSPNYDDKGCVGYERVDLAGVAYVNSWNTQLQLQLKNVQDSSSAITILKNSINNSKLIGILEDDNVNSPSTCSVLTTQVNSINSQYNAGISVPSCSKSGYRGQEIVGPLVDAVRPVVNVVKKIFKSIFG